MTASFVAQQIASSFPPIPPLPPVIKYQKTGHNKKLKRKSTRFPRLRNIDRNSGRDIQVTVDGITVLITDYKLLPKKSESSTKADPEPKSGESSDTELNDTQEDTAESSKIE